MRYSEYFNLHSFTLLELLIVIVIAGIIVTFTIPAYKSTFHYTVLERAARELATFLRHIQHLAILQRERWIVKFDLETSEYAAYRTTTLQSTSFSNIPIYREKSLYFQTVGDNEKKIYRVKKLPKGIKFSKITLFSETNGLFQLRLFELENVHSRDIYLNFYPNGTSDGAEITLSSVRYPEGNIVINVSKITGTIKVFKH